MADQKNGTTDQEEAARSKERSPNYPSLTLTDSIKLVRSLWEKEKRTTVTPEVAARAWDYRSLSGPARSTIGTLRQYGLLESAQNGVRVSDLAMELLHQPEGSEERAKALRTAALNPKLFKELAASHAEASDDALKAHLLTRKAFSEDGAKRCIRAFRDALSLAKLPASGYSENDMGTASEAPTESFASPELGALVNRAFGKPKVTLFSWPLSKGVTAEVRFVGDEPTPTHLERLRQYLELAKAAVQGDGPEG